MKSNYIDIINVIIMKTIVICPMVTLFSLYCESNIYAQSVKQYVSAAQTVQQKTPREILYMQFDKPAYIIGDTIWYSAYLLDAHNYTPSQQSGIAYVEFISPDNGLLERFAIHLFNGHGFAQIPLNKNLLPGNYRIRAYTRWMENFSDSLFFQKEILLVGGTQNWLMNIRSFYQTQRTNTDSVAMHFFLKDQSGGIVKNKIITINVANNKNKTFLSKKLMTKKDGSLNINFSINNDKRNNQISLNILDENKISRISYPINFTQQRNKIDVQFLPESGHLLAGIKSEVAFKAIDENGSGRTIRGIIRNNNRDSVAAFSSLHKGMGAFSFIPKSGENYYAEINRDDTFHLPAVENSGTSLHVDNLSNPDSVFITVYATPDLLGKEYYILGKYKGLIGLWRKNNF